MMQEPRDPEKPSTGQIVLGVVLTIIAIPFLIFAACIPALLVAQAGNFYIAEAVWILGAAGFAIWRAVVTENPGVRWTIIVVIAALIVTVAFLIWEDPAIVSWWR